MYRAIEAREGEQMSLTLPSLFRAFSLTSEGGACVYEWDSSDDSAAEKTLKKGEAKKQKSEGEVREKRIPSRASKPDVQGVWAPFGEYVRVNREKLSKIISVSP